MTNVTGSGNLRVLSSQEEKHSEKTLTDMRWTIRMLEKSAKARRRRVEKLLLQIEGDARKRGEQ